MKQIIQDPTGEIRVVEVPVPVVQRGRVLVRTVASLISSGTERMTVELGRKTLVGKAKERPDLVKQVFQKAKQEGLLSTLNAVRAKLDSSKALGYSAAGVVIGVGEGVTGFSVGDRVSCAGAGFASHAEVLSVPKNLCVRLPEGVNFEAGAFGTLGAIALQGLRLAEPTISEAVVVIGLGLLGQLTVQLLKANGCRVFGVDLDPSRVELARALGADEGALSDEKVRGNIREWARGRGADAVLITAATPSDQPVELAGEISRLKGRVVAVGLVGLNVPRKIFYERELTLKISMSYGPGRYDPEYEERGQDYPLPYVRWTEGRNIEAFLDLVAEGKVQVQPLITHRFPIEESERAYRLIAGGTQEPYLGVILSYDTGRQAQSSIEISRRPAARGDASGGVRVGLVGAGTYARKLLLPNFKTNGADFRAIATASGVSAHDVGVKYGFARLAAGAQEVIDDEDVNLVVIATRHDSHADLARRALERDRHVFVEKPLALSDEELDRVLEAAANSRGQLMVGFNRRFSPLARAAKKFFDHRHGPLSVLYRVNAGRIAREHWIQDPIEGGGRIVGEVCHFIDLMQFWIGAPPVLVFAETIDAGGVQIVESDSVFITLKFADGSNGCIAYLSEGDKALAKERVEIFGGEKAFVLDDFCTATFFEDGRARRKSLRGQDKGHAQEVRVVCDVVRGFCTAPISFNELIATTRATFCILKSIRTRQPQNVTNAG